VKAIMREAEGYTERIARFKGAKGINNNLSVPLNNQEYGICSKGLPRP
jgi:hypothetical protein